ncbi:transposase domain-containing protein, partial [Brucella intermedia]|uniref:transposase domain-containing protein n=1 Tax=Brucella intermedia TaxID=94625 RepID=UPI0013A03CF7
LRGVALGRRNWTFAGSQRGADRTAIMLTFIMTCRLNEVDPKAWLADVLTRLPNHPNLSLNELLPWNWKTLQDVAKASDTQAA